MTDAKARSKAYFDLHHASRFAREGYWSFDYKRSIQALELLRPDNLIDIGCGPGGFLARMRKELPQIRLFALDLSEGMVNEVRERFGGSVEATVGDAENMPLASCTFEAVTVNMSIHHYPHPEKALGEMARILKPGGALLLNDMDCAAPIRAFANWIFPKLPGGDVKMYNRVEIEEMMSSAGFRRIRYMKISPFSFQCVGEKEA